ncbi:MAG: iron chelate uptake ABC transporter family permease subunit [Candidatus Babeliales bacterium]
MITIPFIFDYTLLIIMIGTFFLGLSSGALGVFSLLRKQSLLNDAISHACLPGVALAFLCTYNPTPFFLLSGGALSGGLSTLLIYYVTQTTSLPFDAMLGVTLSVFFGIGLMLMTLIQNTTLPRQAMLNKFIFGNAATLLYSDVLAIVIIASFIILLLIVFWKEFKLMTFNAQQARTMGYPIHRLQFLFTIILLANIVIGLQTVGAILMSAMIIAPAAAARQWCDTLKTHVIVASLCGGIMGTLGSFISSMHPHLPTGPIITILNSALVGFSITYNSYKQHTNKQ